jgi:hypothetical protein
MITEERIDALILCYTRSPEERGCALAFADLQSPPLKSIVLSARKSFDSGEMAQNMLDPRDISAVLLAVLESLVSRPPLSNLLTDREGEAIILTLSRISQRPDLRQQD